MAEENGTPPLDESWATIWEALADSRPQHVVLVVGDRELTWQDLDDRAARFAGALAVRGAGREGGVARLILHPQEHLESIHAGFKLRAPSVDLDPHADAPGIAAACGRIGAEVLVFQGSSGEQVADAVVSMPSPPRLVQIDDGTPLVEGAESYARLVRATDPAPRIERSGHDPWPVTTDAAGRPISPVRRHVDVLLSVVGRADPAADAEVPRTVAELVDAASAAHATGRSPVSLCASPQVDAEMLTEVAATFLLGGTVVLLDDRSFVAEELWDLVQLRGVTEIAVAGDVHVRPMNAALDAAERAGVLHDLSSLRRIVSRGAPISELQRRALRRRAPQVVIEQPDAG